MDINAAGNAAPLGGLSLADATLADATQGAAKRAPVVVVLSHDHSLVALMRSLLGELDLDIYADEIRPTTVQTVVKLRPLALVLDVSLVYEQAAWELVTAIRDHPRTHLLPVVACAAASWLVERQSSFLEHHSITTWTAPFDLGELLGTLASLVQSVV